MTREELKGLQQLNEFSLTENETADTLDIFDFMYGQESCLTDFDTQNVEVMVHVMPMTNVLRSDVREQPFSRDDLLAGAPEHNEDSWQVPRLVK